MIGDHPRSVAWCHRYAAHAAAVRERCRTAVDGMEELDPATLLGEVDHAVEHEDCLTAEDFLFRRSDLGLGPLETALGALPRLLERLGERLGWTPEEHARQREAAEAALQERHAWRSEADPA